jgi:pimeloyl-ACP methyl ester carboxylesterase
MPVLRINATSRGLALHNEAGVSARAFESLGDSDGPAVILLHGYKYAPSQPAHSPHAKIFGDSPEAWPAQLGFGSGQSDDGLAIAFGWYARGALHSVYKRATQLGETLSVLIAMLKARTPHRPVHIVAHSLGAQAALAALGHLPAGAVDRLLLLTGASFSSFAEEMLATPAGRTAEVFNITSRENDFFDLMFEKLVAAPARGDRTIGAGIAAKNTRTLQLDCDRTLAAFARRGFEIASAERRVCHWSAYTRPGVMALYAALLRNPGDLPLDAFDADLPPEPAARWSRLAALGPWPEVSLPTHFPQLPLALRSGKRIMGKVALQGKSHGHAY